MLNLRYHRELLLLFVAYHPPLHEVEQLKACLAQLSTNIGYAVVVNDYQPGEPVELLASDAEAFLANIDNPGYGEAVNRLVAGLTVLPPYIGVLNTDLTWQAGTFQVLLQWLSCHPDVSLATPKIIDQNGEMQMLCKQNPTVLGLFSRRFVPSWLKPAWLKRYDRWYVMADCNYQHAFDVPYLSGCCMLMKSDAFVEVGGFDPGYFLYLEDADITRKMSARGRCMHLPLSSVTHVWGKGNYVKIGLVFVNLASAWHYFWKWGWALW
jgi:GT2 family glycosyltransferase